MTIRKLERPTGEAATRHATSRRDGNRASLTKGFLDAVPHGIELRCEGHLEQMEDPT